MIPYKQQMQYFERIKDATNARTVARRWGLSISYVYRLVDEGKIYGLYVDGRLIISLSSCHHYFGDCEE